MSKLPEKISTNPEIVLQTLDDQTALLNPNTGQIFGLDRVSSRVWELIEVHSDTAKVRQQMLQDFDVDETRLNSDLEIYFSQLLELGLVIENSKK